MVSFLYVPCIFSGNMFKAFYKGTKVYFIAYLILPIIFAKVIIIFFDVLSSLYVHIYYKKNNLSFIEPLIVRKS